LIARLSVVALAVAVGVAFADSSIVVLALPELYVELGASVVGISWIVTAYNLVVLLGALALLPLGRRVAPARVVAFGLVLFLAASIACGLSESLVALIAARCAQGLGGALLLCGALPLLIGLTASAARGTAAWTLAGTVGATFGPALGGVLTELFDWRAIFLAQAPVAALALFSALSSTARGVRPERGREPIRGLAAASVGLLCVFGALVGALFLAVLLIVTVWDFGALAGAAVVSVLPTVALLVRPIARHLPPLLEIAGGAVLLAVGLVGLALLPASSAAYAAPALALCGAGLGLCLPVLTRRSVSSTSPAFSGTLSIAVRHAGLVVALVVIAPVLAVDLERGGERATINATAVIIDAELPLTTKIPIALDLRDEFERTPEGEVPDLVTPFARYATADQLAVEATRDDLLETIGAALTRSFRGAFLVSAAFGLMAALALVRRRVSLR
jgi:MFS family permease